MDPFVKQVVVSWIRNKLDGCANPRQFGKPLQGELTGLWRYRVANYRIVARIDDDRILILILNVGDRKSVYRFKIPRIK